MSVIKNVAIVGGSGTLGTPTLRYLLDSKHFNITAITRSESSATFPSGVKVSKVDYDNKHDLVNAFRGHDAAILVLGAGVMHTQLPLVEAAAEAGVKWIVPTEFSSDSANRKFMEQVSFFGIKDQVRAKIQELGMNYLAVICHLWSEFSINYGLFGIDVHGKKATVYDDAAKMNITDIDTVAMAIVRLLSLPADQLNNYANKHVYVSSALVSQPEIFAAVKKVTNTTDSEWQIKHASVDDRVNEGKKKFAEGNFMAAAGDLVYGYGMKDGFGGDYESTKGLDNEVLGLKTQSVEDLVRAALK
ncbi:hypothetical protein MBLNU457_1660t1 [Dothideomycetes sp. NU457]